MSLPEMSEGAAAGRLADLYAEAEADAVRTAERYLAARVWKRRAARLLRCATVAGVAGAAALPLLGAAGRFCCLALLGAAACVGCDRYLGLTAGWLRDAATAGAVRQRLAALRLDWAGEALRGGGCCHGCEEPCGARGLCGVCGEAVERRLAVLRRFSDDVAELVRAERAERGRALGGGWPLPVGPGGPGACAPGHGAGGGAGRADGAFARGSLRPADRSGGRPSMPRQRPPENG
ncbi:SLATT domain-containing protein [Streptomyces marincola]|uniref:SLATT domain-containing protein n=1 Tax=Streptomyces marincola TaxID=2878388 RepID=UPI001CF2CE6A|nr:SLATT domain-containing protein [Streptomyces marincola]UCM89316.1 SLATT domain-containing protein [Streptomyces marincola]